MRLFLLGVSLVVVLGFAGCSEDEGGPKIDCDTEGPKIALGEVTEATCGEADGAITVTASGGDEVYQFTISNGTPQESGTFEQLSAGRYTVTVTDGNGCGASLSTTVTNFNGVQIAQIETEPSGCESAGGQISITATEGTPPYEYKLGSESYTSNHTFSGISAGNYTVTVRDSEACEFFESVEVLTGVSLQNQILPIISNNCAVSGCHNGSQSPNLSAKSGVLSNASQIKNLTQSGAMPKEGSLTQEQINLIACWVDDGARDN